MMMTMMMMMMMMMMILMKIMMIYDVDSNDADVASSVRLLNHANLSTDVSTTDQMMTPL